ncbi:MAG TPA: SPFH domain-containing protein [Streptosporangiaceae bacterium]
MAPPTVPTPPTPDIAERRAASMPGIPLLALGILGFAVGGILLGVGSSSGGAGPETVIGVLLLILSGLPLQGLTPVMAGEARVIQLFGKYIGTVREPGMHCVNPYARKRKVSTRIRNHETPLAKVNDLDGNPIEIAAVVVWKVEDTAKAIYAVDDFIQFVSTQAETAVRHIATSYAYETHGSGEMSLRDNADEITQRLSAEIQDRVLSAGVHIIESRLTRLSYAAEIAGAMLRRQQANAVVGARMRIVEGAVGMVRMALDRLEEEGVVELDEERKAAMVSNLLVVLCSEQATQQVVNTGSLYQ